MSDHRTYALRCARGGRSLCQRIARAHDVVGKPRRECSTRTPAHAVGMQGGWDSVGVQTPVLLGNVKSLWRKERILL